MQSGVRPVGFRFPVNVGTDAHIRPKQNQTSMGRFCSWSSSLQETGGTAIPYDEIGNPTQMGGAELEWKHSRQKAFFNDLADTAIQSLIR